MLSRISRTRLLFASTLTGALVTSAFAVAEGTSAKTEAQKQQERPATATTVRLSDASAEQVKALQRELSTRGLYQDQIDGVPGAKTRAALRNFQTQQGIAASGELDARTADALGLAASRQAMRPASAANESRARRAAGETELSTLSAAQIQKVQRRLSELGFYQGEVDGVAGDATRTALQRYFQHQTQLAAQGRVSDSAIASLGVQPVRNRAQ
jgi:peptidoglycan hydrolase-like protein with peptidoglycan-binding domain